MPQKIDTRKIDLDLRRKIRDISGQNVSQCFQCGTCSASCPMTEYLDAMPRLVMHLLQFGQADALDGLNTAWVCASCHNCVVRCPRGIDIPRVMEALRQIKLRKNVDHVEVKSLEPEEVVELPQIALVSTFRKLTS